MTRTSVIARISQPYVVSTLTGCPKTGNHLVQKCIPVIAVAVVSLVISGSQIQVLSAPFWETQRRFASSELEVQSAETKVCSDHYGADGDSLPILALRSSHDVFMLTSVQTSAWPYEFLQWCVILGGGWGEIQGMGPNSGAVIGDGFGGNYMIMAWEQWVAGSPSVGRMIDGLPPGEGPVGYVDMGKHPSVGWVTKEPRIPFIAYMQERKDGGSSIYFTESEDYAHYYRNWTTPYEVVGSGGQNALNESPVATADAMGQLHIAYLRSSPGEVRGVYHLRNLQYGRNDSWEAEPGRRLSWTATVNHDIAIAASREGNTVLVVWTATTVGNDDLMYAYSLDGGETFSGALNLSATPYNEGYPAIAVDPDTSTYHVAFWRDDSIPGRTNNVLYTQASWGDPGNWTTPLSVLNIGAVASSTYRRPGIVGYTYQGNHTVKVAWTDARNSSNLDIYWNVANPMSCNITADPTSVPPGVLVNFWANAGGGTSPYTYFWRFGDGSTDWRPATSHAYASPGLYNVVLRVDDAVGNTCFDAVRINVLPPIPDLTILHEDVSLSPSPPYAEGSTVQVNATVRNIGGASSAATVARFHDGLPPSPQIGADQPLPSIPLNGAKNVSVIWTASPTGSHDICVLADPDNLVTEIDETNNIACLPAQVLSLPDLVPKSINITPPPPLLDGTRVQVDVTIANQGDLPSGGFDIVLFDDKNGDLRPDAGENIGSSPSPGLSGHSQTNLSFAWNSSPVGDRIICAFADPPPGNVKESNETNNVACINVLVQPGPPTRPDYVPVQPQPSGPVRVEPLSDLSFSVLVLNQGNATATENATLAFYNETPPTVPLKEFELLPIPPSANSSRLTATWKSPATIGRYRVVANVDYHGNVTEWDENNNVYKWTVDVVSGPITSLVIGNPNYTSGVTYVSSITILQFSVIDQSMMGINRTVYRIDDGMWENYTPSGWFYLSGEGDHYIEWYSEDNAGNVENVTSVVLRLDDTSPTTILSIGNPKYMIGGNFTTSSTPLTLQAFDGGKTPVGVERSSYRIDGGPPRTYSTPFFLTGEGVHTIEYRSYDFLYNQESKRSIRITVDDTPPATIFSMGDPKHLVGGKFVTSTTPLTLQAADGGLIPVGASITRYRIDAGTETDYSSPFTLTGEGVHTVHYFSRDFLANDETTQSIQVVVDDTPPATVARIGTPKYQTTETCVTSSTGINLTSTDGGVLPVGLDRMEYQIDGGGWHTYIANITLTGNDGPYIIDYRSGDFLNNTEEARNVTVVLDNTPPVTTISPATGQFTTDTVFTLTADDAGSDVNITLYRIDGGNWTDYSSGFTLPEGAHNISYMSIDNLWNSETERCLQVTVHTAPPPWVEANYKPIVAVTFAIVLLVVGVWSSKRRPWKGGKERMAVVKAFAITSLPFVIAEIATGVVSLLTGQSSIPPLVGVGTVIDMAILVAGTAAAFIRLLRNAQQKEEAIEYS